MYRPFIGNQNQKFFLKTRAKITLKKKFYPKHQLRTILSFSAYLLDHYIYCFNNLQQMENLFFKKGFKEREWIELNRLKNNLYIDIKKADKGSAATIY